MNRDPKTAALIAALVASGATFPRIRRGKHTNVPVPEYRNWKARERRIRQALRDGRMSHVDAMEAYRRIGAERAMDERAREEAEAS